MTEGLYELTVTKNYFIERQKKNIQCVTEKVFIAETGTQSFCCYSFFLEYEKVFYENFENFEELGFLFYGENLEYGILEKLVKSLVKDVTTFSLSIIFL